MRTQPAWCVHILSNNAHTLYIGATNELLRRYEEHRTRADPAAFTARYTFDRIVYYEYCADEAAAHKREKQLKGWTRAKKVALIERNPWWNDLTPDVDRLFR